MAVALENKKRAFLTTTWIGNKPAIQTIKLTEKIGLTCALGTSNADKPGGMQLTNHHQFAQHRLQRGHLLLRTLKIPGQTQCFTKYLDYGVDNISVHSDFPYRSACSKKAQATR
ncbi:hypothetical protein D9M68_569450 [compost metagenome]